MCSTGEPAGSLKVSNLSAQPGVSRNAWSGDAVLKWKANLTALSQCENLYFIALRDTVYVDRPSFPEQHLCPESEISDLRWHVASSGKQARAGFHNRRYPHGVNRLELDFLGDQEILVCACDDGDVVLYPVSGVTAAFSAVDMGVSQAEAVNRYIQPLFTFNVGISAWGIAIERKARLIAVSSNDHAVHMIALALSRTDDFRAEQAENQVPRLRLPGEMEDLDRSSEARWKLSAHRANIPSVAFHHSDDVEPLTLLLSSDTDSNVIIWNITGGSQIMYKLSPDLAAPMRHYQAVRQYGWIAIPVSSEIFRLTQREDQLCGFTESLRCLDEAVAKTNAVESLGPELPCSIVHTRSHQISLVSHSSTPSIASFLSPWREHERGPPFEGPHRDYGTLKYARKIPELGVIIVASDAGYAGIFTLTRLWDTQKTAPTNSKTGMRLDCIVPLDEQVPRGIHDLRGLQLWSGLLGIATGPMQGASKGRFRLILEYGDRTVLCYELSRSDDALQLTAA